MRASRLLQQQLCFSSCYPRSSYDFGKKKSCSLRGRRFVIFKSFPLIFQRGPEQIVRLRCFLSASGSKFTYITFFWPSVGFGVCTLKKSLNLLFLFLFPSALKLR